MGHCVQRPAPEPSVGGLAKSDLVLVQDQAIPERPFPGIQLILMPFSQQFLQAFIHSILMLQLVIQLDVGIDSKDRVSSSSGASLLDRASATLLVTPFCTPLQSRNQGAWLSTSAGRVSQPSAQAGTLDSGGQSLPQRVGPKGRPPFLDSCN
jgi:hypothetical protein